MNIYQWISCGPRSIWNGFLELGRATYFPLEIVFLHCFFSKHILRVEVFWRHFCWLGTFVLPTLVCEVWSSNMGMAEDTTPNGSFQGDGGQIMRLSILCFREFVWSGEMVKCLRFCMIPTFFVTELARLCEVIFFLERPFCHILSI